MKIKYPRESDYLAIHWRCISNQIIRPYILLLQGQGLLLFFLVYYQRVNRAPKLPTLNTYQNGTLSKATI